MLSHNWWSYFSPQPFTLKKKCAYLQIKSCGECITHPFIFGIPVAFMLNATHVPALWVLTGNTTLPLKLCFCEQIIPLNISLHQYSTNIIIVPQPEDGGEGFYRRGHWRNSILTRDLHTMNSSIILY